MAVSWNRVTNAQADPGTYNTIRNDLKNSATSKVKYVNYEDDSGVNWDKFNADANATNAAATIASAANAYRTAAEDSIDSANSTINTAHGNLSGANSGLVSSLTDILNNGSGSGADEYLQKSIGYSGEAADSAAALSLFIPTLTSNGTTMFNEGTNLVNQSNDYLNAGNSLLALDPNAGGLAGLYAQTLAQLDPNLLVSQSASDVQSSYQNAQGQAERNLARKGVSAGSGASRTLQKQYAQSMATALAAAKTKARQAGVESQLSALRNAVSDAQSLGTTGSNMAEKGVTAQNAGTNATNAAASVLNQQGTIYTNLASIMNTTANAKTSELNARVNAGSVAGTINNNTFNAAKAVVDQSMNAASYYSGMFDQFATMEGDYNNTYYVNGNKVSANTGTQALMNALK